jgi:[acyl-carrier-protein] S-malonyltransferase
MSIERNNGFPFPEGEDRSSHIALVFPGQGKNSNSCIDTLYQLNSEKLTHFNSIYQEINNTPYSLFDQWNLQPLPQDVAQPLITLANCTLYKKLIESNPHITPSVVAGHSLGEVSALVAAGVLSTEDAFKVACLRGKYMNEAPSGKMSAILNTSYADVQGLCDETNSFFYSQETMGNKRNVVFLANQNNTTQHVISGTEQAIEYIVNNLGKKAKVLDVTVPAHTPLMLEAQAHFANALEDIAFFDARIPVALNGRRIQSTNREELKQHIIDQLVQPVNWEQTVMTMSQMGATTFIELGSDVLSGLIKRIYPQAYVLNTIHDPTQIAQVTNHSTNSA